MSPKDRFTLSDFESECTEMDLRFPQIKTAKFLHNEKQTKVKLDKLGNIFCHQQESGNPVQHTMTVAEMATYGLPDNRSPGGNTYKQQVRSMALQPEQRTQQAMDRCVLMFIGHFC